MKKAALSTLALLVLWTLPGPDGLRALEKSLHISQIEHRRWAGSSYVPARAQSLAQTADGRFYVGAEGGVYLFDGLNQRLATSPERVLFSGVRVAASCVDGLGALWVAYESGIVDRKLGLDYDHIPPAEGRVNGRIHDIACGADSLLVASEGGLVHWREGRWTTTAARGLPDSRFVGAFVMPGGAIWAATPDALYVAESSTGTFRQVGEIDSDAQHRVVFAQTPDGSLWMGTSEALLRIGSPAAPSTQIETFRRGRVTALLADREGVLWVGGPGIERFITLETGEQPQRMTRAEGLSGNEVRELYEDRDGNVWVITSGGVDRFSRTPFVRTPKTARLEGAKTLVADGPSLWVGVVERNVALLFREGRLVAELPVPTPEISHRDRAGNIWFAGGAGVSRLVGDRFITQPLPEAASGRRLIAMSSDDAGTLWLAVDSAGLLRLSGTEWLPGSGVQGLPEEPPQAIERDAASGNLWFGYRSGKLFRLSGGQAQEFGSEELKPLGSIMTLHSAPPLLWISAEGGIASLGGNGFMIARQTNCGPIRSVSDLQPTHSGGMWLYRPFGIAYGSNGMYDVSVDSQIRCRNYGPREGVPGEQLGRSGARSLAETSDGRVWIATESDLSWATNPRLATQSLPALATVEYIDVGTRRRPELKPGMRLPAGTRNLEVGFANWTLASADDGRFRHRLIGPGSSNVEEDEWRWVGNSRSAYFGNLGPGNYRFEIQASQIGAGAWGPTFSMPFVILPYLQETGWFRALVLLLLAAGLFALLRRQWHRHTARLRERMDERAQERERIARELHDTLLQGVQGLVLQFQAAAEKIPPEERAAGMMEDLLDRADQVIAESRDRISQLREVPPQTAALPEALAEAATALAGMQGMTTSLKISGDVRALDGSVNSEVFLIAREALSNAVRHSGASHVETELHYERFWFRLRVRDNGKGIPDEFLREGGRPLHFGLGNMRERAKRLRGTLRVALQSAGGTEVEVRIPAALAYPRRNGVRQETPAV